MDRIIDSITLYTIENGLLTSYAAFDALHTASADGLLKRHNCYLAGLRMSLPQITWVSLTDSSQWVSMPHNLIFLGLHFAISKRKSCIPW